MNNTFKSLIFAGIGIAIFLVIGWFFINIIPYLLVAGAIIYIITILKKNSNKENNNGYDANERVETTFKAEPKVYNDDNGKIIDVDYKEVDND